MSYKNLAQDVHVGSQIMLDDGLISMKVVERTETDVLCLVENGGLVKDRKGVNVPGVHLSMPYMSAQDRADILFGIQEGFDFIAASFCRTAQDVMEIRRLLDEHHSDIRIIAKLENQEGVNNVDEILAVADGVMIARGDMGVEIDFTEIPVIQKDIIAYTLGYGKHVITATQMLDSMITNPRPTRAEITDVANAVYDGTSAIMLSGETAAGRYPVEAVKTMAAIASRTEADINYFGRMRNMTPDIRLGIGGATAHAACTTATDTNASAIITVTKAGPPPAHQPVPAGDPHHRLRYGRAGAAAALPHLGGPAPHHALRPEHRRDDRGLCGRGPGRRPHPRWGDRRGHRRRARRHRRDHQYDQGPSGGQQPHQRCRGRG